MKKTDLYRSIDSIKPDKELKVDIIKAVGENDKVTVIKRPLFVPIMVGILVCINIGMAAKLIIFNKSQVNLSELRARTSISSTADTEEMQYNEDIERTNREYNDMIKQQEFLTYAENFQKDIDDGSWYLAEEWIGGKEFNAANSMPYYMTVNWNGEYGDNKSEESAPLSDEYVFRRYIKYFYFTKNKKLSNSFMTNHEYIVAYDGECVMENIVSITESDVDAAKISDEILENEYYSLNNNENVSECMDKTAYKKMTENDPDKKYEIRNYGVLGSLFLYRMNGSGFGNEAVQGCYYDMGNFNEENDERSQDVYDLFFINSKGEDISDNLLKNAAGYWKATVSRPRETENKKIVVPDITGMDINEAEKTLKAAGLKLGSRSYQAPFSSGIGFNQIIGCISCNAGDSVERGTAIDVIVCANAVIPITGLPVDEAFSLLKANGYSYEFKYYEGTDPGRDDLYVYKCYPKENSLLKSSEKITLIIASPEVSAGEELLGSVISEDAIYQGEGAEDKISDAEYRHDLECDLIKMFTDSAYSDIYAYGTYYSNDCFRIRRMEITSEKIYAAPFLKCGMILENGVIDYITNNSFYSENAVWISEESVMDYNYSLSYNRNGRDIRVCIKTAPSGDNAEGEKINKILVSEDTLISGESGELYESD